MGATSRPNTRSAMYIIADALIVLLRTPAPPFASPGAGALKVVRRLWECARFVVEALPSPHSSPSSSNGDAGPSETTVYGRGLAQSIMEPILRVLLSKHAHEPSRPAVAALARSLAAAEMQKAPDIALDVLGSKPAALRVIWSDWAQAISSDLALEADSRRGYEDGDALVAFAIRNACLLGLQEEQNSIDAERVTVLCLSMLEGSPSLSISKSRRALKEFCDSHREDADNNERMILFSTRMCVALFKKVTYRPPGEDSLTLELANTVLLRAYERADKASKLQIDTFKMLAEPLSSFVRSWITGDGDLLIKYLKHLESGLQAWFADEAGKIDDGIYNDDVRKTFLFP